MNMTRFTVNDKWFSERKKDSNDEAERIIVTAAKLILNNIDSARFICKFHTVLVQRLIVL